MFFFCIFATNYYSRENGKTILNISNCANPNFWTFFEGNIFNVMLLESIGPTGLYSILFPFRILWLQYECDFWFFFLIINCKYSLFSSYFDQKCKKYYGFFKFGNIRSLFSSKIHRNLVSYDICLNMQFFFNLTSNYFHF